MENNETIESDEQLPVGSGAGGYKTCPEWIKIKDKLPDDGETVLIAILHRYDNAPWKYSGVEALYKNGRWIGERNHSYATPEYWRPWPKLPFVEDFGGESVL
ncbi:MAG: DUF551 domain-containing protein [Lentisphaerae bacterium]|nr:DUF551 domain-containing protein [Lentisphaerota bacterium]